MSPPPMQNELVVEAEEGEIVEQAGSGSRLQSLSTSRASTRQAATATTTTVGSTSSTTTSSPGKSTQDENGVKRRASPSSNGTSRCEDNRDSGEQVKSNICDRASSPFSSQSLHDSNSPAKVRKIRHGDSPSVSSRSSPSDDLKAVHIGDSSYSNSPAPDKDVEMAPASPTASNVSDHRSTTSSQRRDGSRDRSRRSHSRDEDEPYRRRHRDRSSDRYHSSRSRRSPSPRHSSSSRRDERRSSRDRSYSDRHDYDKDRSSRRKDNRSSHPIMTSGRYDRSDRSFEQELERYSRDRSHRRDDDDHKRSSRDGSREPKARDARVAPEKPADKSTSSRTNTGSSDIKREAQSGAQKGSTKAPKSPLRAATPTMTEARKETPKKEEEPEVDIPILIEEEKDEATLLEERRKKRQELMEKARKAKEAAAASTPTSSAPSSTRATPTLPAVATLTVEPNSPAAASTPGSLGDSQPGTPTSSAEDRPFHRALLSTRKSASDMAILKSKDAYENVAQGTDTDHDMSAADYQEAAPSLPAAVTKKAPAKESMEIDMFAASDDDMFAIGDGADISMSAKPVPKSAAAESGGDYNPTLVDNWDDAEGYYRFGHGELLDGRYLVTSVLGKGVFSSVVKARDSKNGDVEVAIKILRSNEAMYKAGKKELDILSRLMANDPEDKKHVVRLLNHFEHRGHLCLVFESLSMNLREVLKKFGKDVGLNINAVRVYAKQLFSALSLLKKSSILHADIKPDNILVNDAKNLLKLCDLGSASDISENEITPYLVSRFYRAPEIILGLTYDPALDMWSIGCTLYELFTGKILFPGRSNNQMLKHMMDLKGAFPKKMVKKAMFGSNHFDEDYNFLSVEVEKVTQKDVVRTIQYQYSKPVKDLKTRLMPFTNHMAPADIIQVNQFIDLLNQCLSLDPSQRISPDEALRHPFAKGPK
ncbi:U4/U6 small nuclear ribonucleoprotein prp4 [Mortierella sp. AD031]|nr:U4/U6 small nuclear ribonucleoprotein prp4 [Mortierella sp. AD031]